MKQINKTILTIILLISTSLSFAKGVSVEEPYVREVPPGQMISASFMNLKNDSDKEIALIKASSDAAKSVELHEHVHEDGMMKMRQVSEILVPANGSTSLKPGGYHIMLIGLQQKIKAGDKIDLNLEFDNGDKKTITATVKKTMMGMKKGMKMDGMKEVKKMKNDTSHLNPMPNLMLVFKKTPEKLNLNKEQTAALKKGMKERESKIKELFASLKKNESEIMEAALSGTPLTNIDQLANSIMQDRLAIMKGKTGCRESVKEVLDENQFKIMVDLYRAKMMPQAKKMNKMQAKMAMIKHTNPMPNLMLVVKKMGEKLNLSEDQAAKLKAWSDERDPVMAKQYKAIMKFEKEILEVALNNEPVEKIYQLADAITMERIKVIRGKLFCRNKMKSILNADQFKKVIELYKANFITH